MFEAKKIVTKRKDDWFSLKQFKMLLLAPKFEKNNTNNLHCRYVFTGEGIGCVADQQASLTDSTEKK